MGVIGNDKTADGHKQHLKTTNAYHQVQQIVSNTPVNVKLVCGVYLEAEKLVVVLVIVSPRAGVLFS